MKIGIKEIKAIIILLIVVVICIFFYMFIWSLFKENKALNSACKIAGNDYYNTATDRGIIHCEEGECTYNDTKGNKITRNCK